MKFYEQLLKLLRLAFPTFSACRTFLQDLIKYRWLILSLFFFVTLTSCVTPLYNLPKVEFLSETSITPLEKYKYKTSAIIKVEVDKKMYLIPKGFITDLASIPRPLWSFISPRYSAFVAPAILHDYMYRCANVPSRRYADKVFYSGLLNTKIKKFTAWKFFVAVRLFGFSSFNKGCSP